MKQIFTSQKGNMIPALLILIALVLFGGYLFYQKGGLSRMNQPQQAGPIQNDSQLMSAATDLDSANVDGMIDPELNQTTSDATSYAPRIRLKNGTSLNWAGYAVETNLTNPQSYAVSDVKGSWVVPSVNCTNTTSNTYSATWLGIDGYSDGSVEQTGTEQDCSNGAPQYYTWFEMYPHPSYLTSLAINPGDTINAEVRYAGNSTFVLTLTDQTTGKTFSIAQRSKARRQSAEWIMEAPYSGGILPLANFGTQNFTNAGLTLNGHTGTINSIGQFDQITMTNQSGAPKATPSALSPDGKSFNVTWNSN